jgi:hypothetical protein
VAGCGTNQATLNSTAKAKSILPLHSLMCLRVNRSNIVGKVRRQTAFEERGDAKLLRLFPKRHKPATGRAVEEEGRAAAAARHGGGVAQCSTEEGRGGGYTGLQWRDTVDSEFPST